MGVTRDISRSRRGSKEDILDSNTESGAKVTQGEAQGEISHITKEEMEEGKRAEMLVHVCHSAKLSFFG